MSSLQIIRVIARFEMKTLLRSWFFRIFACAFIIGLGIFDIVVFTDNSSDQWIYRALPSIIPYANLIVINVAQAIVGVFLASEFLKQDRKNDTVEVIYVRSMTNGQYVTGKALGVLFVFVILNLILLLMGMGLSFLSSESTINILEFILYPLLISIPTLVFILGLSFFLMTLLKNQAITFIILLGYIALTIFYLNEKYYQLFDFIAYKVPMMSSSIASFGNIIETLLQRCIYLFIGIGLIQFTAFKLQRLSQSKFRYLSLISAFVFVSIGVFSGYTYVDIKQKTKSEKKQMIGLNNRYFNYPKVCIDECDIELEHLNKEIKIRAKLKTTNKSGKAIDTLIFSLNPGLKLNKISINNTEVRYERNLHLLKLKCAKTLKSDASCEIIFDYQGEINENTHFLDVNIDEYKDYLAYELLKVRKRFAYINKDFVCLTREALWYPISGVTYAPNKPAFHQPDFTKYHLDVKTKSNLVAVSQGKSIKKADGEYEFTNEKKLPKISLLIANYTTYKLKLDSVEYSIYTVRGNDYYTKHFTELSDTLPAVIRDLRNEFESLLDLNYSFDRFILAEVPIHFSLDKHIWSLTSNAVQPEIIFYPEKGVWMEETDFESRKSRSEKKIKRKNGEVTQQELQVRVFKDFVRSNLMASPSEKFEYDDVVNRYTYSITPNFYSYVTQLESDRWPVLNLAFETYLNNRNVTEKTYTKKFYKGISKEEKINLELNESNLEQLLKDGISQDAQSDEDDELLTLNDIIMAKGNQLFSLLRARYGDKKFNLFANALIKKNKYKPFSADDFVEEIRERFNDTIVDEIDSWYTATELPGFLVKDLQTYKILDGEFTKYQVRFKISNPENVDGTVDVSIDLKGKNKSRNFFMSKNSKSDYTNKIFIPAKSAKEIGVVFNSEPARMNIYTNISRNLPSKLKYPFSDFDKLKKINKLDSVANCTFFDKIEKENEFIVDNEDPGFSFYQQSNESYLKSLIKKDKNERYKYSGLYFWNPPSEWKAILRSGFYGRYIHSGLYTKAGNGERKVRWQPQLPAEGFYDVYCNIVKMKNYSKKKRKTDYTFKIYHNDGVEDLIFTDDELEEGWNYLGTFYISPEIAKVELSNKSKGKMVFADAIKWIKNN
ncbi:MAG: hypothetical protein MI739_03170 [Bacteroidales bacterium]|nr:hypothetical protein [Bacteroidales bacterium]